MSKMNLPQNLKGDLSLRPRVVCENMSPAELVLGNDLMSGIDPEYPVQQRFRVRQQSVQNVRETVLSLEPPEPVWMSLAPVDVKSAMDVFVRYMMREG